MKAKEMIVLVRDVLVTTFIRNNRDAVVHEPKDGDGDETEMMVSVVSTDGTELRSYMVTIKLIESMPTRRK